MKWFEFLSLVPVAEYILVTTPQVRTLLARVDSARQCKIMHYKLQRLSCRPEVMNSSARIKSRTLIKEISRLME